MTRRRGRPRRRCARGSNRFQARAHAGCALAPRRGSAACATAFICVNTNCAAHPKIRLWQPLFVLQWFAHSSGRASIVPQRATAM